MSLQPSCLVRTHTHTDRHPQSLRFEMRAGSVSFAHTTDAARGHGFRWLIGRSRFVMRLPRYLGFQHILLNR